VDWVHLTGVGLGWDLVNAVMNLRFHWKQEIAWASE
jgi:hypothetical protein